MKVLVTGANGFLGSWLVRRLNQDGVDVRILVRETSDLSELEGCTYEKAIGDVTQLESIIAACEGIDTIFHLAGLVAYKRVDRPKMEAVNVQGTANVVEATQQCKVKRLVHVSSVTAVGASFDGTPLTEASDYNIAHLNLGYFETKHDAEKIVVDAVSTGAIDAVMVNPATIYGPGDAKKGSRNAQLKVARGKMPFYTEGGVNVVPVQNVIEGMMLAWKKGVSGERYILASENISIKELFEIIADQAGVEPPKIKLPNTALSMIGKVGDVLERIGKSGPISSETAWTARLYHWFDSSKAQRELGFDPGDSRKAIRDSVQWAKDNQLI